MRVLLIRPKRPKKCVSIGKIMYCEPLGLEILCSILKPKYFTEIFDMIVDKEKLLVKLKYFKPRVVGITSIGIDVTAVKNMARIIKKYDPYITVIVGGTQAYLDESVFFTKHIDHVFKYTNRYNITGLFNHIKINEDPPLIHGVFSRANSFKGTGVQGRNEYMFPDRGATKKYRKHYSYYGYQPTALVQTSQGCSNACNFCLRWRLEGPREKYFDIISVKAEIQSIKEDTIMIIDNDFFHNKKRVNDFCDFLESHKLRKNFICYGSVKSILKHKHEISRFSKLGLVGVLVGFESFDDNELKYYGNKGTTEANFAAAMFLRQMKVKVFASYILNPDWSIKSFIKFRRGLTRLKSDITSISPLQPFYGTSLYDTYKNRLIEPIDNYRAWNLGTVVVMPSKMKLSTYYYQILLTILYINFGARKISSLLRNLVGLAVTKVGIGTVRISWNYFKLYVNAVKKKM